ncbi:MAG: MATE family efflux transporter [Candidatus Omnitrophica bacterium]|nr:MATE family efflux transporter [Candidatus Omnitrophota bacterium]
MNEIQRRVRGKGGYKEVLVLSFPLILSTSTWAIQHFVDRMFLSWYSAEAIAASMPAGMLNFTVMSLFIGTASFAGTFVAQYYGAGRFDRIGKIVWQGFYVGLAGGLVHLFLIPFAGYIFNFAGHAPEIRVYEIIYFRILCLGAVPAIAASSFSGFFSGRGRPWPVMWISFLQTAVNLVLDYCMIFGRWGFPEMGIAGAASATVISAFFAFAVYALMLRNREFHKFFGAPGVKKLDTILFGRLMHFGLPNGIQFFIDTAGFAIFIMLMGRLGILELAASNIAFNINTLAFMPMIGVGIAVSILVGQNLGRNDADTAERSVYSGFHLTFIYMAAIAFLYVAVPDIFIRPFAPRIYPGDFENIHRMAIVLLRFIAFYCLFDTMNIIFLSALRGAGDTRYTMKMIIIASVFVLIIPAYIVIVLLKLNIYSAWFVATAYVTILGFSFLVRFMKGKWKHMRVIEHMPVEDNL